MTQLSDVERTQLIQAARSMVIRAYAPYSHFRVGAALLTDRGNLFTGCNVENAAYSPCLCAERVAIGAAVAAEGGENLKIHGIAVVSETETDCSPCGVCRQTIREFGSQAIVLFRHAQGWHECSIAELLPFGFHLSSQR